ncbi:MAG: hypothetical protein U1E04_02125 [Hylemonella sp.]|nr:hypothetical protein [Hylemonella sp.]
MDPRGSTIHHTRIVEVIALSRVWLGVAEVSKIRRLSELAPERVLQTLQARERVSWRGWVLKILPPRRIGLSMPAAEWATGILAVSAHGLASELRIDLESVRRICQRMQDMENRHAQARKDEAQDAGCQASELEDG